MCLYTKQICPLRARKDIVCYKRFKMVHFNQMETEVRGMLVRVPIVEPTVMTAYPNSIEKIRPKNTLNAKFQIYGGMIHAFTNLEICNKGRCPIVVFKCIIPKGTLYYKGTNDDICAKKMLVVEKVKKHLKHYQNGKNSKRCLCNIKRCL